MYSASSSSTVEVAKAGPTSSSVSRVRMAEELRGELGLEPEPHKVLAIRFASRRPRRASGRSRSGSVGSAQLDFPWRRRQSV